MAIYDWHVCPCGDPNHLDLELVSTRRRGEVMLRSATFGDCALTDEAEVRRFIDGFERVTVRRGPARRSVPALAT